MPLSGSRVAWPSGERNQLLTKRGPDFIFAASNFFSRGAAIFKSVQLEKKWTTSLVVSFPLYHKVAELEGLAGKGIVLAQDYRGFKNLNQKKSFARNFDERHFT